MRGLIIFYITVKNLIEDNRNDERGGLMAARRLLKIAHGLFLNSVP